MLLSRLNITHAGRLEVLRAEEEQEEPELYTKSSSPSEELCPSSSEDTYMEGDVLLAVAWRKYLKLGMNDEYARRMSSPEFSTVLKRVKLRYSELLTAACSLCGNTDFIGEVGTLFKCDRCGLAKYCGRRCQEKDWVDRHRIECPFLATLSFVRCF